MASMNEDYNRMVKEQKDADEYQLKHGIGIRAMRLREYEQEKKDFNKSTDSMKGWG
jgi:hypothetical protein